MKKLLTFLLACALVFPAALSAASFEGSLRIKMTSGGAKDKPMELDYLLKEGRARINPQLKEKEAAGVGVIMDYTKMETTILMPEQKMYMVTSMKAAVEKAAAQGAKNESEVTLEKTGEKEKILGYTCEKYLIKSKEGNTAMWLTDQLGTFGGLGTNAAAGASGRRGKTQQEQAWEKALAGKNMFPLRVVGSSLEGKETYRMEVTAIEKKPVPDSEFAPPADWKKFEMPPVGDMMKGMFKGMIPGR